MQQTKPVVEIHELTKNYGELKALDGLTLSLSRGQILGFIGPNGAGKTTAIRILVGLSRPTSGWARITGVDCTRNARKIKHLVGYMPDHFGSYDNMRVHEYLDFFGAAFGIPRRKRRLRIDEVMEICGATYMRDRYVESLSHGMQQRIGIARTLLHDPQVLIFDEPANGLDPEARIEMRELLLRLAEMGKTLIVTSHILPELARICDQVAILTQGQLRAFGSLDQIMSNLNQQRLIEVQLATTSMLEQAVQVIRGSIESDAEITSSEAEATVRFRSAQKEADLGQLLAKLVTAGINVTQFREVQSDLEEAFLTVTREHSAAQQTEAMSNRPAESAKETQ